MEMTQVQREAMEKFAEVCRAAAEEWFRDEFAEELALLEGLDKEFS
jgi:hypothetical protein